VNVAESNKGEVDVALETSRTGESLSWKTGGRAPGCWGRIHQKTETKKMGVMIKKTKISSMAKWLLRLKRRGVLPGRHGKSGVTETLS